MTLSEVIEASGVWLGSRRLADSAEIDGTGALYPSSGPANSKAFPGSGEMTLSEAMGFADSAAWGGSAVLAGSPRPADSGGYLLTLPLYPSSPGSFSTAFLGSNPVGVSERIAGSFRFPDSPPPEVSSLMAPTHFGRSVQFGFSRGYQESDRLVETSLGGSAGLANSAAFGANSDFFVGSAWCTASELPNQSQGLARSVAHSASWRFPISSLLDKSSTFVDSMRWRTEDAGELHLSDSNHSFPVASVTGIVIGILAMVVLGGCLVMSQVRAQRTSSTETAVEMGIEEDESSVTYEDEQELYDFVCENPVSDDTFEPFNDQGFSFDMEEALARFT
jgi:hypothetical protein